MEVVAGTPAQQAAYLPDVASGRKIAAFALSEAEAGSDAGALRTTALRGTAAQGCISQRPKSISLRRVSTRAAPSSGRSRCKAAASCCARVRPETHSGT